MLEFLQICIGGLVVGSIYAAIALGFSLVYRVTGAINLSQGGFAIVGRDDRLHAGRCLGLAAVGRDPVRGGGDGRIGMALGAFTFVPALDRLSNAMS